MGVQRLVLIDPQCERNASKAKMAAAAAQHVLEGAVEYSSFDEFYEKEGTGLRIALTRRPGKRRDLRFLKDTLIDLVHTQHLTPTTPLYLFFGPEDNGLSGEDLQLMHRCAELPTYSENGSLNLSQAVLLALFIAQDYFSGLDVRAPAKPSVAPGPLEFPDATLRDWIQSIGFNIDARKASAYLTVKRLLMQNIPTPEDLHVLDSILQQNIRKLRSKGD